MEGITLEQKDILHSLQDAGKGFSHVRIVGGATKSPVWNQIQADIYNLPCETLAINDAAVLGAAISAGAGTHIFSSLAEGAKNMVHIGERYEPVPQNAGKYEELYRIYCDTYEAMEKARVFQKLANL